MKKAGDLLGSFLDSNVLKAAEGYTKLFSAWKSVVGERTAAHSRIAELERTILVVEADHPGWLQMLQLRQGDILTQIRGRFPDLEITGISLRLMRDGQLPVPGSPGGDSRPVRTAQSAAPHAESGAAVETADAAEPAEEGAPTAADGDPYSSIQDENFRDILKRLEKGIRERNGGR